jgi:hypothetical protein
VVSHDSRIAGTGQTVYSAHLTAAIGAEFVERFDKQCGCRHSLWVRSLLRAESWFPRRIVVKIHVGASIMPAGREWTAAVKLRDTARDTMLQQPGEPDLEQKAPPI